MCKEAFSKRLVQLRMAKGVSARDMSLSLGQNPGYITEQLKRLDAAQLDSILRIVNGLVSNHPY